MRHLFYCAILRCLLCAACLYGVPLRAQHYSFTTISQDADAEFPSRLNCITDDHRGYLWIGTRSGLGRYDGFRLKKYLIDETNPFSLPSENISHVTEDLEHELWIFTDGGVVRYDYANEHFIPLLTPEGKPMKANAGCGWKDGLLLETNRSVVYYNKKSQEWRTISQWNDTHLQAQKIVVADEHNLVFQNRSRYMTRVNLDNGERDNFAFPTLMPATDFCFDREKQELWVTTNGSGLYHYALDGRLIAHYTTANTELKTDRLHAITRCKGHLLIGTKELGLYAMQPTTGQLFHLMHEPGDGQFTLPGNSVNLLFTDRYDNPILGIVDHGLVAFGNVFLRSYSNLYSGFGKGPNCNSISCFCPQGDQLWIGTSEGGINRFDPATNHFTYYPSTDHKFVFSIAALNNGQLLLSILNEGLFFFDPATGRTTRPLQLQNPQLDSYIFRHGNGIYLWRNTPETLLIVGRHLYIYHEAQGTFTQATEEKENMIANGTLKMICTEKTVSYLCDRSRIYLFDHASETLSILYTHNREEEVINVATRTPDGLFWLGTNYGFLCYDAKKHELTRIPTQQFRDIMSLQADPNGRVWIGTYTALYSYDPATERLVGYNKTDGVQPNEYVRAVSAFHQGQLYLGGVKGFVQINYQQEDTDANGHPTFTIADCDLNGLPEGNPFSIPSHRVELPYKSNLTLHVMTEEKYRFRTRGYRFRIPSYSHEVIETSHPELQLNGLTAGTYQVQISCTMANGLWSDYQPLAAFTVLPPWYLSFWFISGVSLLVLLLGGGGMWILLERRRNLMQREIEQSHLRLNVEKVEFLVNVSHELRTPLTLIYAPLNRMLRQTAPADANYPLLQTACRQAGRMTNVINMVLDLEKMERKAVRLQLQPHPFNPWVEECMKDYVSEGAERGVKVVFVPDTRISVVDFDLRKCDIVLNNLLINALKHSPEGTTITVRTELDGAAGQAKVTISDQGSGLQPGDMKELFSRFHQGAKESTGTGLGLAYSKVLMEQHKGSIGAYNNADRGASFYFILPLRQDPQDLVADTAPTPDGTALPATGTPRGAATVGGATTIPSDTPRPDIQPRPEAASGGSRSPQQPAAPTETASNYTLLVVDDQREITQFLADSLQHAFQQVLTAKDGVDALKTIRNNRPDIIISDVMMPRMDGFELCRQIKGDLDISHIPVILLTAKTDEQSIMTGYKTGADAYLPKPFDLEVLKQIAFNLLNTRQRVQDKYAAPGAVPLPEEVTISYADEAFLTKLNQLVESNIDNTDLGIGLLESEMAMSRASLFNKLKTLTGMGANEYITKMRMEKAIQLVKDSSLPFTEIAERVGYNTASYFSSAFKQYTGMTPTQYRKTQAEKE